MATVLCLSESLVEERAGAAGGADLRETWEGPQWWGK